MEEAAGWLRLYNFSLFGYVPVVLGLRWVR